MKLRDQVVDLLSGSGYLEMGPSINVGSATFSFDFVLWNGGAGFNLVVGSGLQEDLIRKVSALARALDFVGSKASITLVLEASHLDLRSRSALSQVARVLLIGPETLRDDLRVLLPLDLERRAVDSFDPIEVLRQSVRDNRELIGSGLLAGHAGEVRVREALEQYIEAGLEAS